MNWLRKKKEEFFEKSIFGKIWFIIKKLILLFLLFIILWILWEETQPLCRNKVNKINERFVNNIVEYMKNNGGYKPLQQKEVENILKESGCEIEKIAPDYVLDLGDLNFDFSCSNLDVYGNFIQRKEFNDIYIYLTSKDEPEYLFENRSGIWESWEIDSNLRVEKRHTCSGNLGWGP